MTSVETESTFTFQTLAYIVITIAGGVAAFVTIFFAIRKFSLRIDNDFETSYVDAFSNEYVEFRKFKVKLGFTIRSIKLPKKFDRDSTVSLWYKPANGFRRTMRNDDYDEKLGKREKKIQINDREFLKSKEIELFRSKMIKKLSPTEMSEFEKNISVIPTVNSIRLENKNDEEVQNFSFNMPESVTYDDASFYFDNDNVQEIKASLHEEGNPNEHISDPIMKMTIKKIPAADEHDNPGIITIPLPDSTPS